MAETDDSLVYAGAWGEIRYAPRKDKSMPAKDFYLGLSKGDQSKLNTLFVRMADHGKISNRQKFHRVEDDIWEFKCFRIRISCYQVGRCWYLLHGFEKKGDYWPPGELIRANNLLAEHRG
jgi:Phage derived protein Gp49-like (DUF891)